MRDIFKLGATTWGTIFLIIFVFISISMWGLSSLWWLLTNNMLDRNTFLLISFLTSLALTILGIFIGKNKR